MDTLHFIYDDLPSWAQDPISQSMDQFMHTAMLASAVTFRLATLGGDRQAYIDHALSLPGVEGESGRNALVAQINSFLDRELESEFSSTFGHCTITVWALLENMFRTLATRYLIHESAGWKQKDVAKLKIVLSTYRDLDPEGRALYIVDEIDRPRLAAASRFQHLFEALSLPHPRLEDSTKDTIYELEQVRHALAHRCGRADQKFLKACPRFKEGLAMGDELKVTNQTYTTYNLAVLKYVHALIQSLRDHFTPGSGN